MMAESNMMKTRILSLLALCLVALFPALAAAEGKAETFIKTNQAELATHLKAAESKANQAKIRGVFDKILDYDVLAQKSLGSAEWKKRSEAERAEFTGLLKDLVRQAYERNLRKTLNYNVSFRGESKDDNQYLVRTSAKSKTDAREEPFSIDYLVAGSSQLKIVDIITEGSSLTRSYRSQFRRILKDKGWDELISMMKKKRDSE